MIQLPTTLLNCLAKVNDADVRAYCATRTHRCSSSCRKRRVEINTTSPGDD